MEKSVTTRGNPDGEVVKMADRTIAPSLTRASSSGPLPQTGLQQRAVAGGESFGIRGAVSAARQPAVVVPWDDDISPLESEGRRGSYSALDIAHYFIWRANFDEEFGDNITNLKLQKLVYYAQGFNLAWHDKPLFPESIEAWAHGPVVPDLYYLFREFGARPLPTPKGFDPTSIDAETREILEQVYQVYGQYSAWGLRNLTHQESPWMETTRNGIILTESMRRYFADELTVD